MRHTKEALKWICAALKKHKIPFAVTGGLAAELYGSKRPLADIDIDIPEAKFKELLPEVKKYVLFGPAKYRDKRWNLKLITLKYKGQNIDVCGAEHTKIFDHSSKKWVPLKTTFSKCTMKCFHGVRVPVELESELLEYKKELWRKADKIDVQQMEKTLK